MSEVETTDLDISKTRVTPDYKNVDRMSLGHGNGELPMEFPVIIHLQRHNRDGNVIGWTFDLNVFNRGVIKIKVAKMGGMEIWLTKPDGTEEKLAKLPFVPYDPGK